MGRIDELWPVRGLRLVTGDLELRVPDDETLAELADLTREPIHDPSSMPFSVPWTDAPEGDRLRSTLQFHWRSRAEWSAHDWRLNLVALRGGTVVGTQTVHAHRFAATREVDTGSWVGRRFQGSGVGVAMRRAVLHLAFAGLGALSARSAAFTDNVASQKVSTALGYAPDGTEVHERRGARATMVRFVIGRETWEERSRQWPTVMIDGLEDCRHEFGVAPD
jgi:RimJ/RimL family protein N-acetyltransferase